jgi:hypothetical protein
MKTTIFLGFIFLSICGSLNGQIKKFDFIDSPIRPLRKTPDDILHKRYELPIIKYPDRFKFHDFLAIKPESLKLYSDLIVTEEYPGSSQYFAKSPNLSSSPYENTFFIKPDSTLKLFLIIKDPTLQVDTK